MKRIIPLNAREKKYKEAYKKGAYLYMMRAINIWDLMELGPEMKELYPEIFAYQHDNGGINPGNIVTDINYFDNDQIEMVVHNRYSLPVEHSHTFVEVVYVYSGHGIHFINGISIDMNAGDICIVSPKTEHAFAAENDDTIVLNIMMSQKLFDERFLKIIKGGNLVSRFFERIFYSKEFTPYILFQTGDNVWIQDNMMNMYDEFQKKEYMYKESINLYVRQLFIYLIRNYEMKAIEAESVVQSFKMNIAGVLEYISTNYNRTTLQKTARFFGYNEVYLGKQLQNMTGKTFTELVNEQQMYHAKKLLLETKMSLTEISNEIGCYDSSHFTRKFKKEFGVTPSEYRKNN